MKNIILFALLSVNLLAYPGLTIGKYNNSGQLVVADSTMDVGECNNTGKFICKEGNKKSIFKFGKLAGDGSIIVKSGKLILTIENCIFEGSIECDSNCECEIYTLTPIDKLKFKKSGNGKIIVHNQLINSKL